MRISDWSSDVCSSDLPVRPPGIARLMIAFARIGIDPRLPRFLAAIDQIGCARDAHHQQDGDAALGEAEMVGAVKEADRKSVVEGQGVDVRVEPGGCRINKKNK